MCGGGSNQPTETYVSPPGPGEGIGGIPIGQPDYKSAAQALLSTGKSYGQMAALAAQNAPQMPAMGPPPAPTSAFNGGIGQYLAQRGAQPIGPSPALSAIQGFETQFDPRTAATDMLMNYDPSYEARPLSFYTPNAMANVNFDTSPEPEPAPMSSGGGGRDSSRQLTQEEQAMQRQRGMDNLRRVKDALGMSTGPSAQSRANAASGSGGLY